MYGHLLLFINDIIQDLNCTVRLFADEITIHSLRDFEHLQQDFTYGLKIGQMEYNLCT